MSGAQLVIGELKERSDYGPVLNTQDAARLLHLHVESLRVFVREGKVPCHRFPGGREMRFLRDELIERLRGLPSGTVPNGSSG